MLLAIESSFVATAACMQWDGGFTTVEYRLHLRDAHGAPVASARLDVRDAHGAPSYAYPVDDFRRDAAPVSDDGGTLVLHHVSRGLEFGGSCFAPFGLEIGGTCDSPRYTLRIARGARFVATIDFGSLLSAFPNTTEGVERFGKLPRAKTTLALPLEQAAGAMEHVDHDAAATLHQRWLLASEHHDESAMRALVPVTLDFPIVDRDVVVAEYGGL
jgi:hypothetical protein